MGNCASSPKNKNPKGNESKQPIENAPAKEPVVTDGQQDDSDAPIKQVSGMDVATLKVTPWEKLKRIIDVAESIVEIVLERDFEVLPGSVDGHLLAYAPQINDPEFGDSKIKKIPFILRILVQNEKLVGDSHHIGNIGKTMCFPEYPKFQFNVVASVGDDTPNGGVYPDPTSIWFNVFLGLYEIVAHEKDGWTRPFGYNSDGTINKEDFARLFNVDWNLFSAYMYGVPMSTVEPFTDYTDVLNNLDTKVTVADERKEVVTEGKSKYFDVVTLHGLPSVTAYQSHKKGAAKLEKTTNYQPFWQKSFGFPLEHTNGKEYPDESFPGCQMTGVEWAAWSKKGDTYHTIIFGGGFVNDTQVTNGVVTQESNDRFMQVQQEACEKCIQEQFPDVGFEEPNLS